MQPVLSYDEEIALHTKAELWCNKHTNMGCRVQRCLQQFRDDAECRGYKREFSDCVDNKKKELRSNWQSQAGTTKPK